MPIAPRCKMCLEFFAKKVYPKVWLQGGGGVDAVCVHGWPDKALEAYDNDLDRAYCREWTADTTAKDGKAAQTAAGPALVVCQMWINSAVPSTVSRPDTGSSSPYLGRLLAWPASSLTGQCLDRPILRPATASTGQYFGRVVSPPATGSTGSYLGLNTPVS